MNNLFGLSMTYIMIALLVILGIAASSILWVILRSRVMFVIGVRRTAASCMNRSWGC